MSDEPVPERHDARAARIRSVAVHSMRERYFFWDWGEAIVTKGLLAAAGAICEPEYYRWVTQSIDRWIERSPAPFWPDHVGPGDALLDYWEHSRRDHLIDYALALGVHFERLPRASGGAPLNRPDKPDIAQSVWVDSMHTDGPFLARLGSVVADARWADLAAEVILGEVACLQDPATGLFAHSYSDATRATNAVHWARGCGWAALGLAEVLRWLPPNHAGRPSIQAVFVRLVGTLRDLQAENGHWHVVADSPAAPTEASASALIAEAISIGLAAGALDASFEPMRNRSWRALAEGVEDGVVLNVSERQPVSSSVAYYADRRIGGTYPWGQGSWLLIASRMLRQGT